MKVLYDNFIFQHQTIGGISRYFHELMDYYTKTDSLDFDFPIYYSLNQYIQNADYTKKMQFLMNLPLVKIGEYRKFLRKKNNKAVIKALKSKKHDIFHPTYLDDSFFSTLDKVPKTKLVFTIYDMITENFLDCYGADGKKLVEIKKELAHRADKILTISEFSKSEILRFYTDIPQEKVSVVYLASALKQQQAVNLALPEKYLLFVGARKFYKNFKFLLEAIAPLLKEKNIPIIVASSWSSDDDEKKLINQLGIENLFIHQQPTDDELIELYKHALCYIFPSKYEGFGLPILEAFQFHCPVITSNVASLPEVGGSACEYFNPNDANSIYITVKKVIEDEDLRNDMIMRGQKRYNEFSWEKTAIETAKIYKEVAGEI